MLSSYFEQFEIVYLMGVPISGVMVMVCWLVLLLFFFSKGLLGGRVDQVYLVFFKLIYAVVLENLGKAGGRFFPFVFSLFMFILILNVAGLFPHIFTPTSHIVLTLGFSNSIVLGATIMGVWVFRGNFLSLLMPGGAPLVLGPVLVLIETVSYFTRIISLGVRLAANICAGHLLLIIICGFVGTLLNMG